MVIYLFSYSYYLWNITLKLLCIYLYQSSSSQISNSFKPGINTFLWLTMDPIYSKKKNKSADIKKFSCWAIVLGSFNPDKRRSFFIKNFWVQRCDEIKMYTKRIDFQLSERAHINNHTLNILMPHAEELYG